jgi:hypothetical protein
VLTNESPLYWCDFTIVFGQKVEIYTHNWRERVSLGCANIFAGGCRMEECLAVEKSIVG